MIGAREGLDEVSASLWGRHDGALLLGRLMNFFGRNQKSNPVNAMTARWIIAGGQQHVVKVHSTVGGA